MAKKKSDFIDKHPYIIFGSMVVGGAYILWYLYSKRTQTINGGGEVTIQ